MSQTLTSATQLSGNTLAVGSSAGAVLTLDIFGLMSSAAIQNLATYQLANTAINNILNVDGSAWVYTGAIGDATTNYTFGGIKYKL